MAQFKRKRPPYVLKHPRLLMLFGLVILLFAVVYLQKLMIEKMSIIVLIF
jgi:hypothetical protein